MHAGDGTLYRTSRTSLVWELRGALEEYAYYENHVKPLIETLFHETFRPKYRSGGKNGCYGIQTCSKSLIAFLCKSGFRPGSKTHTLTVPEIIWKSTRNIQRAFLRGVFDTDGCIRFDKNHTRRHYYPKIEVCSASKDFRDGLSQLLHRLGFRHHIWTSHGKYVAYTLCIAGIASAHTWFRTIGTNNPKHIKKFKRLPLAAVDIATVTQPGTVRDC